MKVINIIVSMIGTIALIDLIALILEGSQKLSKVRGDDNQKIRTIVLGIIGGLFGIYATISGVRMGNGVVVTIRDVGPMMAGCLGGPVSGLIAGLIAGLHRLFTGWPDLLVGTTIPCSISTVTIGVLCGLLYKPFTKKKQQGWMAVAIAMCMEVLHLTLVFIYVWIRSDVLSSAVLISQVIIPFLVANGLAFGLLIYNMDMVSQYKKSQQHERQIETELNVATSIQSDMLPAIFPNFPGRKEFSIDASMNPAKEIGGDFYDFFFVDRDHFAFLIADVSGKGVPAAMFMVVSKTVIKNNVTSGMSPSEAMNKANIQLCDGNKSGMFVTVWMGVYEISTGLLTYVNAGHNPPLIKKSSGTFQYLRKLSGLVLAGNKRTTYKQFTTYLNDGDRLFLYTDGITEAMDSENNQYGEDRLLACFSGKYRDKSVTEILGAVSSDVKLFTGDAIQSDDMTMLALMISGEYKTISVEPKPENFEKISDFMVQELKRGDAPESLFNKMNVVLDEIYSNVVRYSGSQDFELGVSSYGGRISLRMEYGGELFDVTKTKTPDVTLPSTDRPIGGLGLFIVKNIMDSVCYHSENERNILTLVKNVEEQEKKASK